jgi:hypothetical protein
MRRGAQVWWVGGESEADLVLLGRWGSGLRDERGSMDGIGAKVGVLDCVCLTSQTSWVVLDYVGCFENALNRAGFHIEPIIAVSF